MIDSPVTQSYDLPSEGLHRATIVDVQDGGIAKSEYGTGQRNVLDITLRMEDEVDSDGKKLRLEQKITNVVNKKSTLGQLLIAVKAPVDFKATKFSGTDEHLLGKTLSIRIQHKRKNNATYADVDWFPKPVTTPTRRQSIAVMDEVCMPGPAARGAKCQN
jgi:hypothetical protein